MPVPVTIADLSTTLTANSPQGGDPIGGTLDDYLRALSCIMKKQFSKGTDIAAATTLTIPVEGSYFVVTGAATVTALSQCFDGRVVRLRFGAGVVLTNSSALILPNNTNITTSAGDCASFVNDGTNIWRCVEYQLFSPPSGRNLLLNASFNINQRQYVSGTNVVAAGIYTLDNWAVMSAGQNVTFNADGADFAAVAPAAGLQQAIEDNFISGGVYTINWEGTASCQINAVTVTKGQNITLPANTVVYVRFIGGTVIRPQLEKGTFATQFDRRFYQTELLLCQRYCYVVSDIYNAGGVAATTTTCMVRFRFPTEMRATPTTSILRTGAFYVSDDYTADPLSAAPSIGGTSIDRRAGGRMLLNGFTGLVAGRYYGTSANFGGCLIMFEATL